MATRLVDGVDFAAEVEQDTRDICVAVGACNVEKRFLAKEEEEENDEEEAMKSEMLSNPLLRALKSAPRLVRNCSVLRYEY